jgi:formate hydrogenlyase subunit 3/multisubunit Na+/H+ antiporter MnhD subunit
MIASPETFVILAVAVPVVGALLIPLFHARPNVREAVTLVTAFILAYAVASLVPSVLAGARPDADLLAVAPGLAIAFEVEPLGLLFALVASGLWIVNSIYSIGYMADQFLFLLCDRNRQHNRHRLREEPLHAIFVLRSADSFHISAGDAQTQR